MNEILIRILYKLSLMRPFTKNDRALLNLDIKKCHLSHWYIEALMKMYSDINQPRYRMRIPHNGP